MNPSELHSVEALNQANASDHLSEREKHLVGLAVTLAPLHRQFGLRRVHMVSMQAVSGAGRSPGVIALDVVDNVLPYIPQEEDKVAWETRKVLGRLQGEQIAPADVPITCTCTRIRARCRIAPNRWGWACARRLPAAFCGASSGAQA